MRCVLLLCLAALGACTGPSARPEALGPPTSPAATQRAAFSTQGMRWVPGGVRQLGAADQLGRPDEYPLHAVAVPGFWMDTTEVTNAQFAAFVAATGYRTTAERPADWEALRQQLPPGTPKPADSLLVPAALVFVPPAQVASLADAGQWWRWQPQASWRQPRGPGSSLRGRASYPVVQVSWDDARAYARWAGKRLPTEAEWECAARGTQAGQPYPWGAEAPERGRPKANTWQGSFPVRNTGWDGFAGLAPVASYAPNGYGLYDLAGNVWEWCADWYQPDYYQQLSGAAPARAPLGPAAGHDPQVPSQPARVVRGGSFMCHSAYCASYRVSARMYASPDTGLENTGFRCVASAPPPRP